MLDKRWMSSCHFTRGRRRAFIKKFDTVRIGKSSWHAIESWSSRLGRGILRKMFRSDARCSSVKTIRRFFKSISDCDDFDWLTAAGCDFAPRVVFEAAENKNLCCLKILNQPPSISWENLDLIQKITLILSWFECYTICLLQNAHV